MSLSRPATFPLLKLPFLCIEPVIKSWDIYEIIFFALSSKKPRQIVKHLKIPLNGIRIFVRECKWIVLGGKSWHIKSKSSETYLPENFFVRKNALMLQNSAIPLYTIKTRSSLVSYTNENETSALKLVMDFLNEMFKCSVGRVDIDEENFQVSGYIGVKSTVILCIHQYSEQPFSYAQSQQLSSMLENLEVTDRCTFWMRDTENDFYCDPKLFKCKELLFWSGTWVTRDILMQFEVPRLTFLGCPFSVEDIAAFVTHWVRSDNNKLEHLYIVFRNGQISLEDFRMAELNPVPFSERTRIPPIETYLIINYSVGLEIVRNDGLVATIHVGRDNFMFYVWHNQ